MSTDPASESCRACSAALDPAAKYCSQCGCERLESSPPALRQQAKWYYNLWFVLFMLFFVLGPFGLPLVWKNPRFSHPVKLVLTIVTALWTIALIALTLRAAQMILGSVTSQNSDLKTLFAY